MSGTILLVDDELTVLSLPEDMWEEYRILKAETGEQAIEMMGDHISLVLMDTEMPVTNGWEALMIIKDDDGWPQVPVFIMLDHEDPDHALKAWVLGADECLQKSLSDSLRQMVQKHLDRRA